MIHYMQDRSAEWPLRHEPTLTRLKSKLGPMPRASLMAMTDYGLSDCEIARYYGISEGSLGRLRRVFETVSDL